MTKARNPQDKEIPPGEERPSSHGTDSPSVTPKDVPTDGTSAAEVVVRKTTCDDPDVKQEAILDDELELTFPASDPLPSTGGITRVEKPAKK